MQRGMRLDVEGYNIRGAIMQVDDEGEQFVAVVLPDNRALSYGLNHPDGNARIFSTPGEAVDAIVSECAKL